MIKNYDVEVTFKVMTSVLNSVEMNLFKKVIEGVGTQTDRQIEW
jgi:hypothetical protein